MEQSDETIIAQIEYFRKEVQTRANLALDELRMEFQDRIAAINLEILSISKECHTDRERKTNL